MFREIKAKFDVKGLYGQNNDKVYHYHFVIERKESGAFNYGDHSCHILNLYDQDKDNAWLRDDYYDTRYDHISTNKDKWVKVWKDFIKREWLNVQSIDLIEYEEKDVEERER